MASERKVELTTAPWIKTPEDAFWIAGRLNRERPRDAQIGLEVYPVHYLMGIPGPARITAERIRNWQQIHKNPQSGEVTPISRIHLPFHYSVSSASARFVSSFWKEQGTMADRWTAMKLAVAIGTVQNKFAINLAGQLDAGINAHVYIAEEADRRGKIDELRGNSREVLLENDLDYPRANMGDILRARDPKRAIAAVEKFKFGGIILGVDHAYGYNIDPMDDFTDSETSAGLKKHLRSVHLAGSGGSGEGGHGLIDLDDERFWEFIRFLKMRTFDNDISLCVDINPFDMGKLKLNEQLEYVRKLVEKLEKAA